MKRTLVVPLILLTIAMNAATAGAHEFIASSTGKTTLTMLTNTVFTTAAGQFLCTGASLASGRVKTTKSNTLTETTQFEGCNAFGAPATVSPAKIRSTADGAVSLLASVTIKTIGCEVRLPSAKNQNLHTIKYVNTNKAIEKKATITGLSSLGTGATCSYPEEQIGVLTGDAIVGLIGGTLEWK